MRTCLLLALISSLCLLAHAEEEFPYLVEVVADQAEVLSGPGTQFYATSELARGKRFDVYRREAGGWLAIQPPAGSFSLVEAAAVEILDEPGVGKISAADVPSWIGSQLSPPERFVSQVRLKKDELVQRLGPAIVSAQGQEWVKIAPPSGEFRWIHDTQIRRVKAEVVHASAASLSAEESAMPIEPVDSMPHLPKKAPSSKTASKPAKPVSKETTTSRSKPQRKPLELEEIEPETDDADEQIALAGGTEDSKDSINEEADESEESAGMITAEEPARLPALKNTKPISGSANQLEKERVEQSGFEGDEAADSAPSIEPPAEEEERPKPAPKRTTKPIEPKLPSRDTPSRDPIEPIGSNKPFSRSPSRKEAGNLPPKGNSDWRTAKSIEQLAQRGDIEPVRSRPTDGFDPRNRAAGDYAEKPARPADPLAPTSEEVDIALEKIDLELTTMLAEDQSKWNFSPLRKRASYLAESARDPADRGRARLMLKKLEQFEARFKTGSRTSAANTDLPNSSAGSGRGRDAASTPASELGKPDPRYDAVGWLKPNLTAKAGSAPYVLVDENSNPISLVAPAPGFRIERYVNKPVGIYGRKGMDVQNGNSPHITAQRIVDLERHMR